MSSNRATTRARRSLQAEDHRGQSLLFPCLLPLVRTPGRKTLCGDVQETAEYAEFHHELRTLFAKDDAFRASVEAFGRAYHAKHSATVDDAELRRRVDTSSAYFLEEFAVFCCRTRRDLPVMVHPGQFSTLAEIAAGRHPQAPDELRELTLVSRRVQGR
ncbi:tRNA-dependent cyclodipeptide synthase [Streptomyces flavochromogenes]|uniref:tRNA-dependent cyclodipeptide synthase n=1 Tax=Streptomyces flavochromogenes TaxID=68199 RepID=UPI00068966D2|nr:tRNA-dependent cyclodipeptide synthase [Streptomyces flavochromogenes]